jgi:phosphatidylethanolamine-binding protein (PEBP) family uncharacterized protein
MLETRRCGSRSDSDRPSSPSGDASHLAHYQIKLYALDQALKLEPGADEETLLKAIKGHVLGQGQLVGTVQRK